MHPLQRPVPLLVLAGLLSMVLAACSPALQSLAPAPATPTVVARKPAAPGAVAAKPTSGPTAAAKPSGSPKPSGTAKPVAAASPAPAAPKPAAKPGPAASGGAAAVSKPAASPPAVVATAVAGLPLVPAPAGVSAEARAAAPSDPLGVAASAGAVAAAADPEAAALCGPGSVLSTHAGQMVGKSATVAIARVAASYQPAVPGDAFYLDDAPYPNHVFTAVIRGEDLGQFRTPPASWQGKGLCVTGPIELHQQRPRIVVTSPSQLRAAR